MTRNSRLTQMHCTSFHRCTWPIQQRRLCRIRVYMKSISALELENFSVGDFILPGDTKDSAQTPHMEGLKFPFLMRVGRPRFAAVKQSTDDTGLVDFDWW